MRVSSDQVLNSLGSSVVILRPHLRIAHRGDALVQRQMRDRAIGAGAGERVLAAGQAEQRADRPRRCDAADRQAVGRGLGGQCQQILPRGGPVVPLVQREHQRPAAGLHDAPHHGEFGRRIRSVPVRGHLDEPLPGILQPHGDAHQLGFLRAQRRGADRRPASCARWCARWRSRTRRRAPPRR